MKKAFSTYTISANRQTLTFKLNGSIMTESFNVLEQDLLDADIVTITGTPKMNNLGEYATIIFNVVKSASNTLSTFDKSGFAFQSTFNPLITKQSIWNFNEYQQISIRYGNWYGAILAPDAEFKSTVGNLYGSVYANSWNTDQVTMDMKFHWYPFQGRVFTTCD
jgi:choice-of-anchor A domain-containing protein